MSGEPEPQAEPDWGDEDFEWSDERSAPPRPVERWRTNTASGAVAAAIALGLQQVFDPEKRDTIAIEQDAPTMPEDPEGVDLHFDPDDRMRTYVVIRPPAPRSE
jgi:hypothetical protein